MESSFFDRTNFEMLYDLMNNDMLERANIALDSLSINARQLIYDGMVEEFSVRLPTDRIEDVNKKVLRKVVPQLVQYTKPQQFADEQLNTFLSEPSSDVAPKITAEETELLHGTQLFNKSVSESELKFKDTQIDLDISSGDRNIWNTKQTDSIYDFVVKFGDVDNNSRQIGADKFSQYAGIIIPNTLKNVVSINLTHVILSDISYSIENTATGTSITKSENTIDKYPYLYLQIDEFSGKYISSSDHGRKSFVKLIKDKSWKEDGHSNVYYHLMNTKGNGARPSVGWTSDTPIADISKMSIRIVTPSGYTLKGINDIFDIDNILEKQDTISIVLKSNLSSNPLNESAWTPDSLYSGHRIKFDNIDFYTDGGIPKKRNGDDADIDGLNLLKNFLYSKEHTIVSHSYSNRAIEIEKEHDYYLQSYPGTTIRPDFNLGDESDAAPIANSIAVNSGKIMNLSIQTNFGFNIKSREYLNNNKLPKPI